MGAAVLAGTSAIAVESASAAAPARHTISGTHPGMGHQRASVHQAGSAPNR